jgi:transposase
MAKNNAVMDDASPSTEVCGNQELVQSIADLTKRNRYLTQRVADLSRRNRVLRRGRLRDKAKLRELEARVAFLERELREARGDAPATARNSSVPPSANPPGAPKPVVKKPTGRPTGAQMGHKGHGRKLLPPEQVDEVVEHRPTHCDRCKIVLPPSLPGEVEARHQQAELLRPAVKITEHQGIACRCPRCGCISRGEIPSSILRSVCGPLLSAAMGCLSACNLVSRRGVEEFLSMVLGMDLSLGSVCAREAELSEALAEPYERLKQEVRAAAVKYVDETGWKRAAQWLWTAATMVVVVFVCSHARIYGVLERLLGKRPHGWICSDRHGIYGKYPKNRRGLCWAHLKRDFQRLVDRGGDSVAIGRKALAITREVFHRWRWFRRGRIGRASLQRELEPLRKQMRQVLKHGADSGIRKTAGLCRRLLALEGPMWRFASVEGLEPTNNLAERMLRRAVIWRKKSFGSHSRGGCRFVERMLSVTMTLKLRGGDVLEYLASAISAHREGRAAPALN